MENLIQVGRKTWERAESAHNRVSLTLQISSIIANGVGCPGYICVFRLRVRDKTKVSWTFDYNYERIHCKKVAIFLVDVGFR